jgi:oligopeptidase A
MVKDSPQPGGPFCDPSLSPSWSDLTPEALVRDVQEALVFAQSGIDAIASLPSSDASYFSVLDALEEITDPLNLAWRRAGHLDSVRNTAEYRKAYNTLVGPVSEFAARLPLNEGLWRAIKAVADHPSFASLSDLEKRHYEETLADFRESGADLGTDEKKELEAIAAELAQITQKFSENVLDAINAWEWTTEDVAELRGLPDSALEEARQAASDKGLGSEDKPVYRFTLQAPSYTPVMTYAENSSLREKVWTAFSKIGYVDPHDNTKLIPRILELRHRKAVLLGEKDFADHTTRRRMVGSGAKALKFVDDFQGQVEARFREEIADLERFRSEMTGEPVMRLNPWDIAFWKEKLSQKRFDFEEEKLRPYFPLQKVISGLHRLVERVFGITVQELPIWFKAEDGTVVGEQDNPDAWEVWHPEVRAYEMKDSASGQIMGYFYADWHPREEKRGGAWMNDLFKGRRGREHVPHVGLICGNMSKPTAKKPALLRIREVETIFHEFGHLLHGLCGDVPVRGLNGISVPWDFVELPSQIMENWCWHRESLELFSGHHETGEAIPEDLLRKMHETRNFFKAWGTMRQLSFGKLDLELHRRPGLLDGQDLQDAVRPLLEKFSPPYAVAVPTNAPSFTHLFGDPLGYAAGYYSYKWAEVLEADAFSRFEEEGILNPVVGAAFRREVLAVGNSRPAAESFRAFRGRDPDLSAILRRDGLN